jgi:transcriptional regulator with XRE-family HTH domain
MATSAAPEDGTGDIPVHPFSDKEISRLVRKLRTKRGWTQETLTELAGLADVKTVQRVEKGESTNRDTRRALARAFGIDDMDFFNRPRPHPNPEQLKAIHDKFERENVVLDAERIVNGRELVLMITVENAFGVRSSPRGLPPAAHDLLILIHDCLLELMDILEVTPRSELLDSYSDKLNDLISGLNAEGHCLYAAQRRFTFLAAFPTGQPITKFVIPLTQ